MIVLVTVRSVAPSFFGISVSSSVTVAVVDCILTVVILSTHGILGSSIGSGGGSLPVPSQ